MPNYDYEIITTGEVITVEQRITEPAHTILEVNGEMRTVRRLISGASPIFFKAGASGGWADQGYSRPKHELQAEKTLGRPLHKPAK